LKEGKKLDPDEKPKNRTADLSPETGSNR